MYGQKLFYCNSGVYMTHFVFYAIFTSVILTTGNANDSSTTSVSESTDNLSDKNSLSSSTFTQTEPSATTLSTETTDVTSVASTGIGVTDEAGTSTPVGSEGTEYTSSSSDNVSSGSSNYSEGTDNTDSAVARQTNKSVIASAVGEESLDVGTTESQSSVSQITTFQESATSTTGIVSSSMESEEEKYQTTVTITDNPKIVTTTPIINGVSSLKVFYTFQLFILFALQIVY
ncbi:unnamed protein product [Schistosoma rodhaini]|uniref:Uncharacterized protein n=1 Tax=Schistosoma rodhaini TaxID=6188 RepID=A0A183QKI0_9TREM|nr:unnamed protein product [Schistosoma rodhaini]